MGRAREGSGALKGRDCVWALNNLADAQHGGIRNGNAQCVFAPRLGKAILEVNVIARVARERSRHAHVNVLCAVNHFDAFADQGSNQRHKRSVGRTTGSVNSTAEEAVEIPNKGCDEIRW